MYKFSAKDDGGAPARPPARPLALLPRLPATLWCATGGMLTCHAPATDRDAWMDAIQVARTGEQGGAARIVDDSIKASVAITRDVVAAAPTENPEALLRARRSEQHALFEKEGVKCRLE